jgi:transcriptional regulator with XRE-family HTH domain
MKTLKQYITESKMTQRELAVRSDLSPGFINDVLKGRKSPSLSVALRIVSATGGKVDIETLVRE